MAINNAVIIVQIIGFGAFTWMGCYLLVRASRRSPLIVLGVAGLLAQAVFFGYSALTDALTDPALFILLERLCWWSAVVPVAAWFGFCSLLARQTRQSPPASPGLGGVRALADALVYLAAGVLILLGSLTDLLMHVPTAVLQAQGMLYLHPGPGYPLYIAYNTLVPAGALVNVLRAMQHSRGDQAAGNRALAWQLRLLFGGGLLFLVGALWLSSRYHWNLPISVLPGYFFLVAGMGLIGYGVAHSGLLLEGQSIQRDFLYTATSVLLVNLLYAGLLVAAGLHSTGGLLLLVGLVTLTHTAFDGGRTLLDRLFFSPDERAARAEARDYATLLGTAPVAPPGFVLTELHAQPGQATSDPTTLDDGPEAAPDAAATTSTAEPTTSAAARPPTPDGPAQAPAALAAAPTELTVPKSFRDTVRRALTNLKSPPRLARSPLLTLGLVEERLHQSGRDDNRLNRAATLRELLIEQIETLRPPDDASSRVGDAWRFYNVLYYPYVREVSRKGALSEARRLATQRQAAGQPTPGSFEQVLDWLADVDENTFYKWQRRASDAIATILWEQDQPAASGPLLAPDLAQNGPVANPSATVQRPRSPEASAAALPASRQADADQDA